MEAFFTIMDNIPFIVECFSTIMKWFSKIMETDLQDYACTVTSSRPCSYEF